MRLWALSRQRPRLRCRQPGMWWLFHTKQCFNIKEVNFRNGREQSVQFHIFYFGDNIALDM